MTCLLQWPPSEVRGILQPDEAHVWVWALDPLTTKVDKHAALLSEAEQQRMHRFHFAADRTRFAVSHGNMRRILGPYLDLPPAAIVLQSNAYGKPTLVASIPGTDLSFSLSHSRQVGTLAVVRARAVGVDVEDVRPIEREVAAAHFSARELADLDRLHDDEWLSAFYRCWTRKEAILKAEGVGLYRALDGFDVSLLPGAPPALLGARIPFSQPWKLYDLLPAEHTLGALAVPGRLDRLSLFSLPV